MLWPAALALANRLAHDPALVRGRRVLELGCGPGLPGLIAQWRGGKVTQTDYQEAPLALARENAAGNQVTGICILRGDWRAFPPIGLYDLVIGSDILYERALHPALRALLPRVLAPRGTLLLADPLRPQASQFLDALEGEGWRVAMDVMTIAWQGEAREIALFTARREGF
jgi:predicted nicotinamide N-methyase